MHPQKKSSHKAKIYLKIKENKMIQNIPTQAPVAPPAVNFGKKPSVKKIIARVDRHYLAYNKTHTDMKSQNMLDQYRRYANQYADEPDKSVKAIYGKFIREVYAKVVGNIS